MVQMDEQTLQIMHLLCSPDNLNVELGLQLAVSLEKRAITAALCILSGLYNEPATALTYKHILQIRESAYVNFQNVRLSYLPPALQICQKGEQFFLHGNRFTELPDIFGTFPQLKRLQLHDNLFSEFPKAILRATGLKELFLNRNQLTSIPPEIKELKQLEVLALGGNRLETLPIELLELKNLKKVFLTDNPLRFGSIPSALFHPNRTPKALVDALTNLPKA